MIVVRNTFQIKFGRMKEALALMKENLARGREVSSSGKPRVMTDLTGNFYTLVMELEYPNMAEAEKDARTVMQAPGWHETYQKLADLVDSGSREIYTVVE